jgi:riboflavin synthase
MFTGIIEAVGAIAAIEPQGEDLKIRIETHSLDRDDLQLGDSVAVNGICLTVSSLLGDGFWADVSGETLNHSTFSQLHSGTRVNLEKALTPTTRLGGHLVSGHVDGVGEIISRQPDGRSERITVKAPNELARYIAHKGSITVDGISLTVNRVDGAQFELNIVPHTMEGTTLMGLYVGSRVNLEVDLLARYLERLLQGERAAEPEGGSVSYALLAENGFLR